MSCCCSYPYISHVSLSHNTHTSLTMFSISGRRVKEIVWHFWKSTFLISGGGIDEKINISLTFVH